MGWMWLLARSLRKDIRYRSFEVEGTPLMVFFCLKKDEILQLRGRQMAELARAESDIDRKKLAESHETEIAGLKKRHNTEILNAGSGIGLTIAETAQAGDPDEDLELRLKEERKKMEMELERQKREFEEEQQRRLETELEKMQSQVR